MGFSNSKAIILKPTKEKYLLTFLLGLLVSAAFFLPYMIMSEGYFTFYGDFNVQQIPFYQECHKAIKEGNIFWSWTTDLGANFIGSYSFYLLGSPFFWLTIPFPNSFVPYLMGPLLILKFGCAALTAYLYIRRFTRTSDAAMLGGLLYAFSGFSIYNIFFNHFHEPIIFFPLLLLSLEMLITENRRLVFAIMVCICAVTNYFFFFGMVVFAVIYFFVRLFSGAIKVKISRFLVLAFEAVMGLALAAFILVPSIMAITGNNRISDTLMGWNAIMYGKEQIYANVLQCFFFPPDIPARPIFFPGAEVKWSSLGGWLPVFSMVGVFTWFSKRKNHWLKRVLGICIFMSMVPILNSAFYAFNTSYYARWFYMPVLLMSMATVMLTEDSTVDWGYGYKWVMGITIAVTAVIGFFPKREDDESISFGLFTEDGDGSFTYLSRFWIACAIAIVSLLILGLLFKMLKNNRKSFYKTATVCVCIISVIYGNVFIASGRAHSYEIKEVMIDQLIEGDADLQDDSEYRIDVYDGVDNTSMYLGIPGINAFHSVVPASIFEFYDFFDVDRSVASRPETDLYAIRPLLSVKYLLNPKCGDSFLDDENEPEMYGYKYIKTHNDYYIYENENYIPYGFSYDYYMDYEFCEEYSDESRATMMLKAMLLTEEQITKYSQYMIDIRTLEGMGYNPGETSLLMNDSSFEFDCEKLRITSAKSFSRDNKGFTAVVEREQPNLVFFSVPYDEGWTATVNGNPVEVEKVNSGLMAVLVPEGESTIRFNYRTPGLSEGIIITFLSIIILAIYGGISYYKKKQKGVDYTEYPEGDSLLIQWRLQESNDLQNGNDDLQEKSILDSMDENNTQPADNGFDGGFEINTDIFDEN